MDSPTPIKAFVFYAHKDYELAQHFFDELKDYAEASNTFDWSFWIDTDILASENWDTTIKKGIEESDIAFLLLSAPFLASKYIKTVEFREFIKRRKASNFPIFPILLKKCPYRNWEELSTIQVFKLKEEPSPVPFKTYVYSKEEQKEDFLMGIIEQAELVLEKRIEELKDKSKRAGLISDSQHTKITARLEKQKRELQESDDRFSVDDILSEWLEVNFELLVNQFLEFYESNKLRLFPGRSREEVEEIINHFLSFVNYQFIFSKAFNVEEMENFYSKENMSVPYRYSKDLVKAIDFMQKTNKENLHEVGVKAFNDVLEIFKQEFSKY